MSQATADLIVAGLLGLAFVSLLVSQWFSWEVLWMARSAGWRWAGVVLVLGSIGGLLYVAHVAHVAL